jgi:hypothetical protein
LKPEREQDRARRVAGQALRGLTFDAVGADAAHAALDQTRPHASVDAARLRPLHDERSQRAGGSLQDRRVALERPQRCLETEGCECGTHAFEACPDACRCFQPGRVRKTAPKLLARLSERLLSASSRKLPDQEADQVRQPPVGKLDPFQFGRDAIDLRRTSGAGPDPSTATLKCDCEKAGLRQAIQAAPCDVAMDAEGRRSLGGRKRIALGARVQKDAAELGIARRCEAIERHSRKSYPPARERSSPAPKGTPKQRRIG